MKKKVIILIILCLVGTSCSTKDSHKKNKTTTTDNIFEQHKNEKQQETTDDIVTYIDEKITEAEQVTEQEKDNNTEKKLRNTFITLTDFIFYNGKIKGYTFNELKETEKEKILNLWEKLDSSIENKYPNYKDNIKNTSKKTYSNIKEKEMAVKQKIIDKLIETIGEEKYNETVEQYNEDKENLKNNTNVYIEKGQEIKEKAAETYENTKSKLKEWYENYKSNN